MTDKLDAARAYVESINREEALLDFDETQFPLLQTMFQTKDPYDKLWTTALNFTVKNEEWMHGAPAQTVSQFSLRRPVCRNWVHTGKSGQLETVAEFDWSRRVSGSYGKSKI